MEETIYLTDEPYLILYTSGVFESIVNAPRKTEYFTTPQQPINLEVDPDIATIPKKILATIHKYLGTSYVPN